jgi:hypothetical protein
VTIDARIPTGTTVEIRLRSAGSRAELSSARWTEPLQGSPINLLKQADDLPNERFLEVEAQLVSDDRSASPSLERITVQVNCPG